MPAHTASARPGRKAFGGAATAATAVTAAAGLLLVGCSLPGGTSRSLTADATVTEAVTAVEVTDARSGSIEVTPGAGPGVRVHRTVHYRGDATPEPGQRVSDGVLTFTAGCADSCRVDYRLEVPASAKVRLDNSSGRITVAGVAAAEVTSGSGDVRAERITGPLRIRTASGDIEATALRAPDAEIRSASGDATVGFAAPPASLSVTTTSGDVRARLPGGPYEVTASTTSGDRDVTLASTPAAPSRLSFRTTSGDLHVSG
ncbi:lipoprotein [Streptomyces lavendulae subsp. lavendulae]|uniref:DUF4097 family beta strand repeat-containing protein n=1 Tax=Streptomyces lavendulae TaxID=1914 RepID=UPI0024A3D15B|nr:DUF4097 family beta strand repeat-containing protein [Streptomyces lavendulae]GLV80933.1 lipoprotein [Streptomyces lavendulae subsp. lavendulae]